MYCNGENTSCWPVFSFREGEHVHRVAWVFHCHPEDCWVGSAPLAWLVISDAFEVLV